MSLLSLSSHDTTPYWTLPAAPAFPALSRDLTVDVVVDGRAG
jgi:hypothetical protein